jgi:hypothetical protein
MQTTTCPGYVAELPAAVEVMHAHVQWKHGTLPAYLDGEQPTPTALVCLAAFEGGIHEHNAAKMRESAKGGKA